MRMTFAGIFSNDMAGIQVYNIRTYGAKVDGVTDDSAAVTAAINAAKATAGGIIFFPRGTTKLGGQASTIDLGATNQGQYIFQGEGSASKIMFYRMGTNVGLWMGGAGSIVFRDLCIVGENDGVDSTANYEASNVAMSISGCWHLMFDNVIWAGIAAVNVMLEVTASNVTFRDCLFGGCTAPTYYLIGANTSLQSFKMYNCQFIDYYWMDGILYNKLSVISGGNNKAWLGIIADAALGALKTPNAIILKDCTFDENTTDTLLKLSGTAFNSVLIENCGLNGGLGGTTPIKLNTFAKATIRNTWAGYNTGTWTSLEATDVGQVDIDGLVHDNGATDIELLGTTKRLKLRNCQDVTITNTANAFIDADQAMPATASATALAPLGATTHVTGTTAITSITTTNLKAGDVLTLIFDSTAQISDGNNLVLNGNFTGGANRVLTLKYDGTNFVEQSRSAN